MRDKICATFLRSIEVLERVRKFFLLIARESKKILLGSLQITNFDLMDHFNLYNNCLLYENFGKK